MRRAPSSPSACPPTSGVWQRASPSPALGRDRPLDRGSARRRIGSAARTGSHRAGRTGRARRRGWPATARRPGPLGQGGEQRRRIGMARLAEEIARRLLLDLLARILDDDAIGRLGDHAHVVGDDDEPHAGLVLEAAQEIEDLRLDGHVERRRRLVGDQELRPAGERHGDHHALAHAARELVREGSRGAAPDR